MKYIVVSGGVISGIGKGVISSSIGLILKANGQRVTSIKIDPYLNIDAGTFSPYEHGECFVLDDGGEVDLDLGNYERFVDISLTRDNNITTGKIYERVIMKERRGDFLGKTVQVVPHVTNEIQDWITRVAHVAVDGTDQVPDVCVIELGGTIGDIEGAHFVEALRQLSYRVGSASFMLVHVSLLPTVGSSPEQKTKPTQHSVRELRGLGLTPDAVICRSTRQIDQSTKDKLSIFCQVPPAAVISVPDCSSLYGVPLQLIEQGLLPIVESKLKLNSSNIATSALMARWNSLATRAVSLPETVRVTIVGKYTRSATDAYHSLIKSLEHAALFADRKIAIDWIEADQLSNTSSSSTSECDEAWRILKASAAILVPGGFGDRGIEGMILACNYARTHKIPYLGICLGMQIAVIEHARNVLHWDSANSEEFVPSTAAPDTRRVVVFMPEGSKDKMGGTMRLGLRGTCLRPQMSLARALYDNRDVVYERHRHRYEVNPEYIDVFEQSGLRFVGRDETNCRMEILERDHSSHPFFVGVQYHPEYLTRPLAPNPIIKGFILAALGDIPNFLASRKTNLHPYNT